MKQKRRRRRLRPEVKIKVTTEWMSREETQVYLRLTNVRALYRLVETARLPAYRLGKKNLIFARSEIDDYIRAQRVEPGSRKRKKVKPS